MKQLEYIVVNCNQNVKNGIQPNESLRITLDTLIYLICLMWINEIKMKVPFQDHQYNEKKTCYSKVSF